MAFDLGGNPYAQQKTVQDYTQQKQQLQGNDQKLKEGEIKRLVSVVNPENYSSVRQEGIQKGLWSEDQLPQQWTDGVANTVSQLRTHFGSNSTTPSAIQEYNLYKQLPPDEQEQYLNVKRANNPLNMGNYYGRVNPVTNNVEKVADIEIKPDNEPALKGQQKAAETKAVAEATTQTSDERVLPVIDQLTKYNQESFDMPYADTGIARFAERMSPIISTQNKRKNTDLLKQARLDLAAPLAKQLGVNPTDKDFQASLDRIFDTNSNKTSRQAQIDALAERIKIRQKPNLNSPINPQQPQGRTVVKTQVSPSTGKRKIIYSDGSEEIQ